ncbi:hypothetical protein Dimus_004955 [Dionaea muscipula]
MRRKESDYSSGHALFLFLLILLAGGKFVEGDNLETDKQVLLSLKTFLEAKNPVNRGRYCLWNQSSPDPCNWPGISCLSGNPRVTGVDLSGYEIYGEIFTNFSGLTELSSLDLSQNTLTGQIPSDLNNCKNLKYLNLSHNLIEGELNLNGLNSLETLDVSLNRIQGDIGSTFPAVCSQLKIANISSNNFTGQIDRSFDECLNLQYLDVSENNFTGQLWPRLSRLDMFCASDNRFSGLISPSLFSGDCSLQILDLSGNQFYGGFPAEISNCRSLNVLNLWGNKFSGQIPASLGAISSLEALILGSNNFSRDIPRSLLNCSNLALLDLSNNGLRGDIPHILGEFTQLVSLVLHKNSFTGGIVSSGILNLPHIARLDLSFNNFSGPLPVGISKMTSMLFLVLAYNQFSGPIPHEYGSIPRLQALDLSFNSLSGQIPSTLGNLTSLLWLMLASNSLTGQIPPELGNCSSLLWLNLANNQLNGTIPPELTKVGSNPLPTFLWNQRDPQKFHGAGECLTLMRWIPADYPPFSFVYTLLTRKSCRSLWDQILKGHGLFPVCLPGTTARTLQISGYLQLSGNKLSGQIPSQIGQMQNFTMLHIGSNRFDGPLPPDIGDLPLVVLNVSNNSFSSEIPWQIGKLSCLEILDLSYNNFSGTFPVSLNSLSEVSKFNVSFNPLLTGMVPSTGQLATFDRDSFLGDPDLILSAFPTSSNGTQPSWGKCKKALRLTSFLIFLIVAFAIIIFAVLSVIICMVFRARGSEPGRRLNKGEFQDEYASSGSNASSSLWLPDTVEVIRLDKTAFTHADILKATCNFSEDRVIGRGGFGTVYKGVLPDGRAVAVKKLQRGGIEGEREFLAEMEVLSGNRVDCPHPNLVTLYGWCLDGSEKILVYEFMEGGTLEDLIPDVASLTWRRRLDIAIDVAHALLFLHHECYPAIVHRDVKASNVLLDRNGKARVTDFGLARIFDAGDTHVSTTVAGTVGYVAPEYGQTWQATTKGDVYSFGVLVMELATGRRALDGGEECLVEWARRVIMGNEHQGLALSTIQGLIVGSGSSEGAEELFQMLQVGIKCTAEAPQARPNMKEVLSMLLYISGSLGDVSSGSSRSSNLV